MGVILRQELSHAKVILDILAILDNYLSTDSEKPQQYTPTLRKHIYKE